MAAITCTYCRSLLPFKVNGQLDEAAAAAVAQHLLTCRDCRRIAAEWEAIATVVHIEASRLQPATSFADARSELHARLQNLISPAEKGLHIVETDIAQQHSTSTPAYPASVITSRQPMRRGFSLAAVLLLLVAGVMAFYIFHTSSDLGAGCSPDKTSVNLLPRANLADISLTSSTEGWAAGAIYSADATSEEGIIYHLHDCRWSADALRVPGARLQAIAMVSSHEGWAVGSTQHPVNSVTTNTSLETILLFHYLNGQWSRVTLADAPALSSVYIQHISMLSATDGWMLAASNSGPTPTDNLIYHYHNGTWQRIPLPFDGTKIAISDLTVTTAGDCFLVVDDFTELENTAAIARYHNGAWSLWYAPKNVAITGITMTPKGNGWAYGSVAGNGGETQAFMARFAANSWQPVTLPVPFFTKNASGGIYAGAAPNEDDGWFSGSGDSGTCILRFHDGAWSVDYRLPPNRATVGISRILMANERDGWAIISGGLHGAGGLLHYHDGVWQLYTA